MTHGGAPVGDAFAIVPAEPPASAGARIAAAIGAFIVLIGGAVISLGAILLAPLAMPIAAAIWRQRRKSLPVVGHWVAAVCGAAVVILAYGAITTVLVPRSTWTQMRTTMDSASLTAPQPPARTPAESAGRVAARRAMSSSKARQVGLAYGFGFAAIFLVAIFGTIGWIGGMLVGFAATGRWPGTITPPPASYSLGDV